MGRGFLIESGTLLGPTPFQYEVVVGPVDIGIGIERICALRVTVLFEINVIALAEMAPGPGRPRERGQSMGLVCGSQPHPLADDVAGRTTNGRGPDESLLAGHHSVDTDLIVSAVDEYPADTVPTRGPDRHAVYLLFMRGAAEGFRHEHLPVGIVGVKYRDKAPCVVHVHTSPGAFASTASRSILWKAGALMNHLPTQRTNKAARTRMPTKTPIAMRLMLGGSALALAISSAR